MILPVVMAGGTGSRLWPMSRQMNPKQFLRLTSPDQSMMQTTLSRLQGLAPAAPIVICNENHRFLVAEQLRELKQTQASILLEPVGRNTAPAIAVAALHALERGDDPVLLVLAADHYMANVEAFHESIESANRLAESGKLVTFGVVPTQPETGYGYIKRGQPVQEGFDVAEFVEKPDLQTAQTYLESGDYFWNSGMFMFKASRYLEELEAFQPEMFKATKAALEGGEKDLDFVRLNSEAFAACPDDSIDYAVMEKTDQAAVVLLDAGWSDIGSWSALWEIGDKDASNNVCHGDVKTIDSRNCFIQAEDRLVATLGLDNMVVVETKDAVLVAHKDRVQDVKQIVTEIKEDGRHEHMNHREVYRPWGMYDAIDQGQRYQVKRITVKPGQKLSVQMHHHRAEHWVVVSGTAKVTVEAETKLITENQSIYIPCGHVHALENPGKIPLELIEVQSGSYLGEDDIVRFEDRYGRVAKVD